MGGGEGPEVQSGGEGEGGERKLRQRRRENRLDGSHSFFLASCRGAVTMAAAAVITHTHTHMHTHTHTMQPPEN